MTAKIDVFSFGVLILEIISGRKNYDSQLNEQDRELLKLVSYLSKTYPIQLVVMVMMYRGHELTIHVYICFCLLQAWRLEREGRLLELVDETIGSFSRHNVLTCFRVGLLCCQQLIQDRPTMSSAMLMLSNDSVTVPIPGRPGFQDITSDDVPVAVDTQGTTDQETESFSKNSITFSLPHGR